MPVIRRADDDRVDVLVGEQLAIVRVAGDAVVRLPGFPGVKVVDVLLAVLHAVRVEVAHGHDPRGVELADVREVVPARDAPDADGADVDPVARRGRPENGRGDDGRETSDDRRSGRSLRGGREERAPGLFPIACLCHNASFQESVSEKCEHAPRSGVRD
jgi:hypothetical protein